MRMVWMTHVKRPVDDVENEERGWKNITRVFIDGVGGDWSRRAPAGETAARATSLDAVRIGRVPKGLKGQRRRRLYNCPIMHVCLTKFCDNMIFGEPRLLYKSTKHFLTHKKTTMWYILDRTLINVPILHYQISNIQVNEQED